MTATRNAVIDTGPYTLEVTIAADADLDGAFAAIDRNTGEKLTIYGWLIENIEYEDEA